MNLNLTTKCLRFKKGIFLEEECDTSECILFLESGLINVSIALPNGKWTRVRQVKPMEFFSLSSFITPNENLVFKTLSEVVVHLIDKEVFFDYALKNPSFFKHYMTSMHQRVHYLLEKIVLFSIQNNKQRIAYFFISEIRKQNNHIVTIEMNKSCILDCLGISRGSFYRELNALVDSKCITLQSNHTYICNLEGLYDVFENSK